MLTSQITTLALTRATKPSKWMPLTIASVIHSISTLTKKQRDADGEHDHGQREQLDDGLDERVDDAEHGGGDAAASVQPATVASPTRRDGRVERDRVAGPGPDGVASRRRS